MNIFAYDRTSCILCGARMESGANWCAKEIRLLYTSSVDCTQATLSGVGLIRHGSIVQVPVDPNEVDMSREPTGLDERPGFIKVRLHSLKRHQHTQTLRQHGLLFVRPLVPFLWGFAIHSFCWDMLNAENAPDLQVLFQACLSMPLSRSGAVDWGHDYIGRMKPLPIEDPRGSKIGVKDWIGNWWERATPSQVPQIQGIVEAEHIAPSTAQPMPEKGQHMPTADDCFLSLPTELREMVLLNLPSKDVYALRLASPVFANMQLSEEFWASRFAFYHEFGYVLEAQSLKPRSWRSLYFAIDRLKQTPTLPLEGRYRVWRLSKMLKHQLREAVHPACHGEPVIGLIEPQHSVEWLKIQWQTATRGLVNEPEFFEFGCRPLRTRVARVPTPLRLDKVVVSFASIGAEKYISGLELLIHNNSSVKLGYTGREEQRIEVDESLLPICGWHLALGMSGIQGMAVIMKDGSLSSWVGKCENLPQYSLRGGGGDLLAMKGEFDAFRMVSLSIHTSNMEDRTWINNRPWKYLCPWMPEIPPDHYFLDGNGQEYAHWYMGMEGTDVGKSRPIDAFYFGGSHGEFLPLLKEIVVWALVGINLQITGIEFTYTDSRRDRFFGRITSGSDMQHEVIGDPEVVKFNVPIDGPGGERIKCIDVLYTKLFDTKPLLKGLKIRTNLRTTEALPVPKAPKRKITSNIVDSSENPNQVVDQHRTVEVPKNWVTLEPRGQELVGFYAVLGWNMIEHFGLISISKP